ncbi:MAG: DUF3575 domain-containing protein [Crocinitomicaceae bacterium]
MKKGLLGCIMLISANLFAQDNAVKIDLLPFAAGFFNVNYERKLTDKFSANLKFSYFKRSQVGFFSGFEEGLAGIDEEIRQIIIDNYNVPSNNLEITTNAADLNFNTFKTELQLRYYLQGEAIKGLYIAPYLGFRNARIKDLEYSFTHPDFGTDHAGEFRMRGNILGLGVGIGNHWVNASGLSLDIMWIGVGFGSSNFKLSLLETEGELIDFTNYTADADKIIADFEEDPAANALFRKVTYELSDDSAELVAKRFLGYGRFLNFKIGYAF